MFALLIRSLRPADTDVMLDLSHTMLGGLSDLARVNCLFAVVDEAQVAAEYLDKSFRSLPQGLICVWFCMRSTDFSGTLASFGGSSLLELAYR